jgi:hypothetical protein
VLEVLHELVSDGKTVRVILKCKFHAVSMPAHIPVFKSEKQKFCWYHTPFLIRWDPEMARSTEGPQKSFCWTKEPWT